MSEEPKKEPESRIMIGWIQKKKLLEKNKEIQKLASNNVFIEIIKKARKKLKLLGVWYEFKESLTQNERINLEFLEKYYKQN